MTRDEVIDVLSVVAEMWPHSKLGDPEVAVALWLRELEAYDRETVEAAVRRLGDREFAPTAGIVAGEAQRALQNPPPGFDELADAFFRAVPMPVFLREVYDANGAYTAAATARAIALLQAGGAHEALLRHVQERGLRAFLLAPDGSRFPLDPNQLADRRDAARHYRDLTLPGWRRQPGPGLALERACQTARLDGYELLELAARAQQRHHLRAAAQRAQLPAGSPAEDETGPDVELDMGEALRVFREQRNQARLRQAAELTARRDANRAAQRAALDELSEHRRRSEVVSR